MKAEDLKNVSIQLAKAFNTAPTYTFVDEMALTTRYSRKEVEIFMDFNPNLSETEVKKVLFIAQVQEDY